MEQAFSPGEHRPADETLLGVVIGVRALAGILLINAVSNDDRHPELAEAWQIAQARFQELIRALSDNDLTDSLEDQLIVLGLVGPEIRYRAEVFDGLLQASSGCDDPQGTPLDSSDLGGPTVFVSGALQTGISVLRTMSQLKEFGNCAEALAGFCEGLLAGSLLREAILSRETNSHGSATSNNR